MKTERKHWTIRKHWVLMMEDVILHVAWTWEIWRYRKTNLVKSVFFFCCFFFSVCPLLLVSQLKESMPGLRRRCINSGSIRGIGVHTSRSFCRRYYRRRSRCILPSPISLGHKWERLRLHSLQYELGTFLFPKCNITVQKWKWDLGSLVALMCQLKLKCLTYSDAVLD